MQYKTNIIVRQTLVASSSAI